MLFKDFNSFSARFVRGDNWHNLDEKKGNLGYGWIHYAIICSIKPKKILCVGSKWGFVPAVCAMACHDCGWGTVDFVDASFDSEVDGPQAWGGAGIWSKVKAKDYFSPFGNRLKLHVETTAEFARKNNDLFDYIYIDGDHSYEGARSDFFLLWPRLKKGGFMVFHDIHSRYEGKLYGCGMFWRKLTRLMRSRVEMPGEYGLGIIQKEDNLWSKISFMLLKYGR